MADGIDCTAKDGAEAPGGRNLMDVHPQMPAEPVSQAPETKHPRWARNSLITIASLLLLLLVRVLLHPLLRSVLTFQQPLHQAIRANLFYLAAALAVSVGLCVWLLLAYRRPNALARAINWPVLVLGIGLLWPSPMILDPGEILLANWGAQMRAAVLARDAIWAGELPGYTFRQANGASYLTQYPPLATLLEAIPMTVGVQPELAVKLVGLLFHAVAVLGLFVLLLQLGVRTLPAAAGAVAACLTQQYWSNGMLTGSVASWCAIALIPWCAAALIRLIRQPSIRRAFIAGSMAGLVIPSHPVYTLDFSYFILIGLVLAFVFLYRQMLRALPFLLLSAAVAVCVGSPYIVSMLLYRPYNVYRPDAISAYQFPAPVFLRTLIWSAHLGSPPGIGGDFTGYIGAILWICAIIAPFLILSGHMPVKIRNVQLTIYLAFLAFSLFLMYGSTLSVYHYIPYVYLNKLPNRISPFLLMLIAAGFALCCERLMTRPRLLALLVGIVLLEQLPFCTRPYYSTPDTLTSFLNSSVGHKPKQEILSGDEEVYDRVYRGVTLDGLSDFYYIHHEEQGATGPVFWQISAALASGNCSILTNDLSEKLHWLGVTHLFFSQPPAPCFRQLGAYRSALAGSVPVYFVEMDSNATIDRETSKIVLPVTAERVKNGREILPISYTPGLSARQGNRQLQLSDEDGFVEACCLSSDQEPITVVHRWPLAYYAAYLVSLSLLLVTAFFAVRERRSD